MLAGARILCACILMQSALVAGHPANATDGSCTASPAITVINGEMLGALAGTPVENISLYRYANGELLPIVAQIDQRDEDGRYLLGERTVLDENDELVFATADAGSRLPFTSAYRTDLDLTEIRSGTVPGNSPAGWVYASPHKSGLPPAGKTLISYLADEDSVETTVYRAGFSTDTPFLVETLQWNLGDAGQWSPDLIDSMKIRHLGKLFGMVLFERSHKDYTSVLGEIKTGPLRVIRRTENRIRVFWHLSSPRLDIDYVMSPDGFVMDTVIDIPFSPGLFFSDLVTLTTVDWNPSAELAPMVLESGDGITRLQINGTPSEKEAEFNRSSSNSFKVLTKTGVIVSRIDIPDDFPVRSTLYLRDDLESADPPEQFKGQFGNVGFKTTGWEDINTAVHHLKFTVCFSPDPTSGN